VRGDGQRATGDPLRLLAQRSELAYTADLGHAMPREPEAVSESYQRRITLEVERRDRKQRLDAWRTANATITGAVATFRSSCRIDRHVESTLHALERCAARLDREVTR
jgi:hypothetical protein